MENLTNPMGVNEVEKTPKKKFATLLIVVILIVLILGVMVWVFTRNVGLDGNETGAPTLTEEEKEAIRVALTATSVPEIKAEEKKVIKEALEETSVPTLSEQEKEAIRKALTQ